MKTNPSLAWPWLRLTVAPPRAQPNCQSKMVLIDGELKIIIFARRHIVAGEELAGAAYEKLNAEQQAAADAAAAEAAAAEGEAEEGGDEAGE